MRKTWKRYGPVLMIVVVMAVLMSIVISGTVTVSGKGATYVGSAACNECHDKQYAQWRKTTHATVIRKVSDYPSAIMGDFDSKDSNRAFKKSDVVYTSGSIWKQRYIDKDWHVLPAQWNYETQKWAPYNAEKWKEDDWREKCGYCHSTGFNRAKKNWKELGVGCEACHGPGSLHVEHKQAKETDELGKEPDIINPSNLSPNVAADICGQCHTRGTSPDKKFNYPVNYMPGQQLQARNFTPVPKTDTAAWWPNGSVKQHRQQYLEWKETPHAKAGVTCVTCHDPHVTTNKFQTRTTQNNLCLGCHPQISTDAVAGHAPVGGTLRQHSDCIGCHMTRTGKSAEAGDERTHSFKFIAPVATINLGGGDQKVQPNSCNGCHAGAPVANLSADFAERLPFRATRP